MSTVNNGPQIVRSGLVLDLDASLVSSYSAIAVYSVQCYSTYNGGVRSANYTVQYSDDNSTWTTAFTGVMSNNSSCGIITGTNRNDSNYSKHRYWRYVEGGAVVGHHPRVSRIDFITKSGAIYNLTTYTTDNCADSGTYIVGTVTKDFGTTTWRDTSGNGRNGTLTSGPLFNTSNKGNILFDGSTQYVTTSNIALSFTTFSMECLVKYTSLSGDQGLFTYNNTNFINLWKGSGLGMRWEVNPSSQVITGANDLATGVWYHFIGVYNGSQGILYRNGIVYAGPTTLTSHTSEAANFEIGRYNGAGNTNGNIAIARFYTRALTATEVSQNYETTKTRFGL
jgi:hypothetical protein